MGKKKADGGEQKARSGFHWKEVGAFLAMLVAAVTLVGLMLNSYIRQVEELEDRVRWLEARHVETASYLGRERTKLQENALSHFWQMCQATGGEPGLYDFVCKYPARELPYQEWLSDEVPPPPEISEP